MSCRVAIDGIIFSLQRAGGVSSYFIELLKMLKVESMRFSLGLEMPLSQDFELLHGDSVVRQARPLERYLNCRVMAALKPTVFHSSYYRQYCDAKTPSVVTVHDFVYERYSARARRWIHSWQKNASIRSANVLICVSEATRQDLLHFVGVRSDQEVRVIHNGVGDDFGRLALPSPLTPFVLYIGQRGGYKNFRLAAQALEFLPELMLYCVGGGQIQAVELERLAPGVAMRIKHLGFINNEQLNQLYNQAICLVYPSSYEGFGIPVLEAMKSGCPVVSVRCAAVMEVGKDALLVAEDADPQAIANAINLSLSSDRAQIVKRGLEVASAYSWEITHRQTLQVYREVAGC